MLFAWIFNLAVFQDSIVHKRLGRPFQRLDFCNLLSFIGRIVELYILRQRSPLLLLLQANGIQIIVIILISQCIDIVRIKPVKNKLFVNDDFSHRARFIVNVKLVPTIDDVTIRRRIHFKISGFLPDLHLITHGAGGVQHQHDVRGHLLFHRGDLAGGKSLQRQRVGAVWLELGSLAQDQTVLFLTGCQSRRWKQRQHQNQRKQRRYGFFCCFSCTSHICFLPALLSAAAVLPQPRMFFIHTSADAPALLPSSYRACRCVLPKMPETSLLRPGGPGPPPPGSGSLPDSSPCRGT